MEKSIVKPLFVFSVIISLFFFLGACAPKVKKEKQEKTMVFPSDVLPFMDQWKILLGDGTYKDSGVGQD